MLTIRLPDGSTHEFPDHATGLDVAAKISPRLASAALGVQVGPVISDVMRPLAEITDERPIPVQILTEKDPQSLGILRHSCARHHGPGGDAAVSRCATRLRPDDRERLLLRHRFAARRSARTISRASKRRWRRSSPPPSRSSASSARSHEGRSSSCEGMKQGYKVEHIDDELKKYPTVSFYRQGEFIDLCRGPHIPHAGGVGAFKLLSIAGAYWKNDRSRKQLQRLYGTAFFNQKDLDAYLATARRGQEARSSRARQAAEAVHHQPGGRQRTDPVDAEGRDRPRHAGNVHQGRTAEARLSPVYTPHIGRLELYRTSGHFPYYRDAQFPPMYSPACRRRARSVPVSAVARRPRRQAASRTFSDYMQAAHFIPPDYERAATPGGEARMPSMQLCLHAAEGAARRSARISRGDQDHSSRAEALLRLADGSGRLPAQADELPAPHPDLQGRAAQLSRSAGAAGGVRHRLSLRADRRTQRHDPRPRLHPGRRPPVLTPEQVEAELRRQHRTGAVRASRPRAERLPRPRRPARSGQRQVRRQRRELGQGRSHAARRRQEPAA